MSSFYTGGGTKRKNWLLAGWWFFENLFKSFSSSAKSNCTYLILHQNVLRTIHIENFESIVVPEKLFKVIIIGDPTVGKTSFVQRYVDNTYKKDYKGTVGVDFALKVLKWTESQTVKLQLWDIAGQERFTWMTRVYYKDAHGCVIMFDLTNKNSFVNSLKWKRDVDSKCSLPDGRPIPCMLLANKCDLNHRQVDQAEVEAFHKEHNFCGWTETSAKEGLMVTDSMRFLIEVMMRQESAPNTANCFDDNFKLAGPALKSKKNCAC